MASQGKCAGKPLTSLHTFFDDLSQALEEKSDDPLTGAIQSHDIEAIRTKWNKEALLYIHPDTGLSYLQLAVMMGNLESADFMIQEGADVNYMAYKPQKYTCLSCLHLAVGLRRDVALLERLLDGGCDTECHLFVKSDSDTDVNGFTPLHIAILNHDLGIFDSLVRHKAVLNAQTVGGLSPLHLAAAVDNNVLTNKLLELGVMRHVYAKNGATALYTAAEYGSLKVLKILLENGFAVDKKVTGGVTPLHAAALIGSATVVDALCDAVCDKEATASAVDEKGKFLEGADAIRDATALHMAIEKGHVECVESLLKNHANSQAVCSKKKDDENLSTLHLAVIKDSEHLVDLLIKYGADVNAETDIGMTPLLCAVILKRTGIVKCLLEKDGIRVNKCVNGSTTSPLIYAMNSDLEEIANLLIEHPATDLDQKVVWEEDDGEIHRQVTPIHLAVIKGQTKLVEALIKRGANVTSRMNFNDGEELDVTLMHNVARYNEKDMIQMLVDAGTPLDVQTSEGITPLMMAAELPNVQLMKVLLDKGVDVNKQDSIHDMTVLMRTAEDGFIQATKLLIDSPHCDLNMQDDEGMTALHSTLTCGRNVIAHMLIEAGADINIATGVVDNRDSITPLILAIEYSDPRMVRRLLAKGADPNARFMRGFTPLHLAAQLNKVEMMKDLLKYGAKINAESTRGETPLHFALYFESLAAAEVLIRRGAQMTANGEITSTLKGTVIHYAAHKALVDIIDLLVDFGAEIFATGKSGSYRDVGPLSFACTSETQGSLHCFKKLVLVGCDVSAKKSNAHDAIPVIWDALRSYKSQEQWDLNRIKLLLRHGALFTKNDLLRKVCDRPKVELIRLVIQAGIDVSTPYLLDDDDDDDDSGKILPFMDVTKNGNPECLRLISNFGCDFNCKEKRGLSALHLAAGEGATDNLEYLVGCGADVNSRATYTPLEDATPLHVAALAGEIEMLEFLKVAGCDFNAVCRNTAREERDNVTALHLAVTKEQDEDFIGCLLRYGCDPFIQNSAGETALFLAVELYRSKAFKALMHVNCGVNIGTHLLVTPLIRAIMKGGRENRRQTMVADLIQAGCDVNAEAMLSQEDDDDEDAFLADFTALHVAAEKGCAPIVKMLIEAGAWLEACATRGSVLGYTPFHCAVLKSHGDVIKILAEAGCNINAQFEHGHSAIHLSVSNNNMEITKQLINLGINPTLLCGDDQIPASALSENPELTSLLVAYEASWKYKHQRPSIQRRPSLHQRISMRAIEEFNTENYNSDGPHGMGVVEDERGEESGERDEEFGERDEESGERDEEPGERDEGSGQTDEESSESD